MQKKTRAIHWVESDKEKPPGFSAVNVKIEGRTKPVKAWWSERQKCWIRKLDSPTGRLWGSDLIIKDKVTHWRKLQKPAYTLD